MASKRDGMLYIGVTSDLLGRVFAHKNDLADGFTNKYHIHNLVHFEITEDINSAISREKQLKKWNRACVCVDRKIELTPHRHLKMTP
jgi:putative endonuclease